MRVCAIHQPNFIPWLPYFDKIAKSNIFIFLDNVAYPKSGNSMGSWCNRVIVDMNGCDLWFSCPVVRESGIQLIKSVEINYSQINLGKWLYSLKCAYARHANFSMIERIFIDAFNEKYKYIADFNIAIIKKICELLEIDGNFFRQSNLTDTSLAANDMLINLCQNVSASHYLSGMGAVDYMDDKKFQESGVKVIYQEQNYTESVTLIKRYSILHYLMTTNVNDWSKFNA